MRFNLDIVWLLGTYSIPIDNRQTLNFNMNYDCSYVELNQVETQLIQEKYRVHPSMDTVLLFNEDTTRPIASLSMSDIPTATLNNVISANQYLALPRLSSQGMLEGIVLIGNCKDNQRH